VRVLTFVRVGIAACGEEWRSFPQTEDRSVHRAYPTLLLTTLATAAFANAHDYRAPRLPDGQIDLQGVWSHTNLTPLERPADLKTFVITPAEAAAIEAKIDARNEDLSRPAEPSLYFDKRTIEPIRGELRSSIIVEPPDGMIPGNALFKEQAAKAKASVLTAFDGPEERPGSERCLSSLSAAPPVTLVPATDLRQIVQTANAILIYSEELHEARVIRMNAKHAPAAVTSWLGDSIGWWEAGTLVIETTHFAPTSATRAGPASLFFVSPQTIVTERIKRVAADELSYTFTVSDPMYYTAKWHGETRFKRSNAQLLEYACHEGNYSLTYVLQGRASDTQAPALSQRQEHLASEARSRVGGPPVPRRAALVEL
jgi:hypothetical protein